MPAALSVTKHDPYSIRRPVYSPLFRGAAQAEILARPHNGEDDDANTAQTVALMIDAATADRLAPNVIDATRKATAGATAPRQKAQRIFDWIRSHVTFQEDAITAALAGMPEPAAAEILIRPADLLAMPAPVGDCDDFTMLAVAMLAAAGIPARVTAIEQDRTRPNLFSHVYAEALIDGTWTPFDASHGDRLGWYAKATGKTKSWKGPEPMRHAHLGAIDWDALLNKGIDLTGKILVPRLGVPQAPGAYTRLPDGTIAANQPTGSAITFPGGATAASIGDDNSGAALLGFAGLAVAAIVFMKIAKS